MSALAVGSVTARPSFRRRRAGRCNSRSPSRPERRSRCGLPTFETGTPGTSFPAGSERSRTCRPGNTRLVTECSRNVAGAGMAPFRPRQIIGKWKGGFALDVHTLSSIPIGYNEFGHMQFETTRSEVGELLYKLKNR